MENFSRGEKYGYRYATQYEVECMAYKQLDEVKANEDLVAFQTEMRVQLKKNAVDLNVTPDEEVQAIQQRAEQSVVEDIEKLIIHLQRKIKQYDINLSAILPPDYLDTLYSGASASTSTRVNVDAAEDKLKKLKSIQLYCHNEHMNPIGKKKGKEKAIDASHILECQVKLARILIRKFSYDYPNKINFSGEISIEQQLKIYSDVSNTTDISQLEKQIEKQQIAVDRYEREQLNFALQLHAALAEIDDAKSPNGSRNSPQAARHLASHGVFSGSDIQKSGALKQYATEAARQTMINNLDGKDVRAQLSRYMGVILEFIKNDLGAFVHTVDDAVRQGLESKQSLYSTATRETLKINDKNFHYLTFILAYMKPDSYTAQELKLLSVKSGAWIKIARGVGRAAELNRDMDVNPARVYR